MAVQKSHRSLRLKRIRLLNNIYLKKLKSIGLTKTKRENVSKSAAFSSQKHHIGNLFL